MTPPPQIPRSRSPTARRVASVLLTITLFTSLGACGRYRSLPLETLPASLQAPDPVALSQDARNIDRPYLRPVAIDLSRPLDANAIAVIAVLANPDLQALRVRAGVADAQVFAAGLLPDPTFSLGIDTIVAGPPAASNIAGALGLGLAALRTRGAVRAQAQAAARQVRLDLAWAEWQTAGQARLQAERVIGLERSVVLLTSSRDAAQSLLGRKLRASGRGDLMPDQVEAARLSAFDAADRLRIAERDLSAARSELIRLLGLPPGFQLWLAPSPYAPPRGQAAELFVVAARVRLDLKALEAGYGAQEAAVRKAILDQFPTLDLTVNASRDTGRNTLLGPAIAFTLPLWNRNRGGIAIATATRAALNAEYGARLARTRADIAAAIDAIAIVQRQRAAILTDLPALEKFAAASRRAANRGDLALATAETAEAALRDKQLLLVQAERDGAEQSIALELLTGTLKESWPQ